MRQRQRRAQSGQAAVEFVFVLVILVGLTTALFQALHFELDVFNKMNLLRYKVFKEAHENQDTTDIDNVSGITVEGKKLADLIPYRLPLAEVDTNMHYGPKKLVIKHGTKYWDPPMPHSFWAWSAFLVPSHEEDLASVFNSAIDALQSIADAIPTI